MRAELRLHQLFDALGERAVAARMAAGDGLADIDELCADDAGLVERDGNRSWTWPCQSCLAG